MICFMARMTGIEVHYVTDDGKEKVISLDVMRRHCRPERVEDLLGDLAYMCEDVEDGCRPQDPGRQRNRRPVFAVIRGSG